MVIPVIRLAKVFHIGTLDPAQLGANSGQSSQEGHCLSVSLCPNAWSSIARLGGQLHELRSDGGAFLDITAVLADDEAKSELVAWGVGQGYARLRKLWRSWRFDSEAEEWRYMLCKSRSEALEEARGYDDEGYPTAEDVPGPEGHTGIEPVTVPVGSAKLRKLTGYSLRPDEDAFDALAVAYAMVDVTARTGIELDGVWWRETFDPATLSAPRGGIFPGRVGLWSAVRAELEDIDDDIELDGMSETESLEAASIRPR